MCDSPNHVAYSGMLTSAYIHTLGQRVWQMKQDLRLKRLAPDAYTTQAVEILAALKKLGEQVRRSPRFEL